MLHLASSDMRVTQTKEVMLTQILPRLTRSMSTAGDPGQAHNKWAIGTNHTWTRQIGMDGMLLQQKT